MDKSFLLLISQSKNSKISKCFAFQLTNIFPLTNFCIACDILHSIMSRALKRCMISNSVLFNEHARFCFHVSVRLIVDNRELPCEMKDMKKILGGQ